MTPDSFSDGGVHINLKNAVAHAEQLLTEGACRIDIGGESSRPGAKSVSPDEELHRVLPTIQVLASHGVPMSIDTRNASTAKACLEAGVTWLNDISALTHDPDMIPVAKDFEKVILMHMRGTPETMQSNLEYSDIIAEIKVYLASRIEASGIPRNRLLIDPGLGFGKSTQQCLEILQRLGEFQELGPVYIGPSRKNFIGELTGEKNPAERDYGTLGAVLRAAQNGANFIRVHNVKAAVQAISAYNGTYTQLGFSSDSPDDNLRLW